MPLLIWNEFKKAYQAELEGGSIIRVDGDYFAEAEQEMANNLIAEGRLSSMEEALKQAWEELSQSEAWTSDMDGVSIEEAKRFGRPSGGRSERIQFSATPELKTWLEKQAGKNESLSQVVYRLLSEKRNNKENRDVVQTNA